MQVYFTVAPRGNHFRVLDHEGYVFGPPFHERKSAESYSDALNEARNRRANVMPARPALVLVSTPKLSLRERLRTLANKVFHYRHIRIGL